MPVTRQHPESGFTMIATMLAMSVIMLLAVVAVAAVRGDTNLTRNDYDHKLAFEAAKAGIDDYAFHLNSSNSYWAKCTTVPTPNAVNQVGSTSNRRKVPGNTGAEYAIELLPSTSQTTYTACSTSNPTTSMLESSGTLPGSFRIRSTGFSRSVKTSIVATFKPPSFLDYVYFTQLETLDPVTYGYANGSAQLEGAYKQCTLTYEQGRANSYIPGTKVWNDDENEYEYDYCTEIAFISGDTLEGPVHTNDSFYMSGSPSFGRTSQDMIEVSASPPGYHPASSTPNFIGTFVTKAPILKPPASNAQLASIAQSTFKYTGQVRICLSGTTMTVGTGSTCTGKYSGAIPSNGVVYVANGSCSGGTYSPFTATYPTTSGCGNVYISGSYSGQLTIAAENDIIINGNIDRSGEGMLGLIANNFVRIYHPFCPSASGTPTCTTTTAQTGRDDCNSGENGTGTMTDPRIDAAILAISHSFIVDHYDCGNGMGTLNVEGAIVQNFRGTVGKGSHGFIKNYVYDDRLRYLAPPYFIEPVTSNWVIGRETIG